MSVKETSAIGFLANIFLSSDEVERIMTPAELDEFIEATDTSMITVSVPRTAQTRHLEEQTGDDFGIIEDDDYKDMELFEVFGTGYRGYMLIVRDPMRVFVGTPSDFGGYGTKLSNMIERTGAVAGINGGGFDDLGGVGKGGTPSGIIIREGILVWGEDSGSGNVIGFDDEGILHVGSMTPDKALELNMQWAVSFGPTIISNGVPNRRESGVNPRTAIGQRADGAVLMLVVDGRQIDSLGATINDLIDIMLEYGAVNAANLDGGSSTLLIVDGEEINKSASIAGPRYLPSAFLVRPLEEGVDG